MKYENTKRALEIYDQDQEELDRMYDRIINNRQFYEWEAKKLAVEARVRLAYLEDTKEMNSWSQIHGMSISAIKNIIKEDEERES